ncbi:FecR family protein [Persicitalea sp.]|uniref:FecR family protein n=1 Tax=Persicitalea sp. TaxID=3100273 RepID=UPI0035946FAC
MNKTPYTLTELIQNDDFIAWVLHPGEASNRQWREYLAAFPEKQQTMEDAKGYVILLAEDTGRHKPTPEQSDRMRQVVESNIYQEEEEESGTVLQSTHEIFDWRRWRMAATVAVLLGVGAVSYQYLNQLSEPFATHTEVSPDNRDRLQRTNDSTKPMTIILADGSSVVLLPGSVLEYSMAEHPKRREVRLVGRAFFEIVKNQEKPFFVYTDDVATKVLGTSFLIDAPADQDELKVEVKTGQVAVFPLSRNPTEAERAAADKPELRGLLVVQDEKVAVSRLSGKAIKTNTTPVRAIAPEDISEQAFIFDETPVSEVFSALELAYNVKIEYDAQTMGGCPLNATLVGEPFIKKLNVICAALDAKYEMKENLVTITGAGCR